MKLVRNFNDFVKQTASNTYQTHLHNDLLAEDLTKGLVFDKSGKITNLKFVSEFVQKNADKLHHLRGDHRPCAWRDPSVLFRT